MTSEKLVLSVYVSADICIFSTGAGSASLAAVEVGSEILFKVAEVRSFDMFDPERSSLPFIEPQSMRNGLGSPFLKVVMKVLGTFWVAPYGPPIIPLNLLKIF